MDMNNKIKFNNSQKIDDKFFEKLANIEHDIWINWQKYLHSRLEPVYKGKTLLGYILPPALVENWERQINTKYEDLTEKEKDSDREQVARYTDIIDDIVHEVMSGW